MATKQQVCDLHKKHPTWTALDIADVLGCGVGYVRATATRCSLTLPVCEKKRAAAYALGRAARRAGLTHLDITCIANFMEARA